MDDVDRKLLVLLQMDATMAVTELADQVGLSVTPVAVVDMAAFDGFYKRLIDTVKLKNVTSRFAMERLKNTTAYPLPAEAFRDRRLAT